MKICLSVNSAWNVVNFRSGLISAFLAEGHEVVVIAPRDEYVEEIEELGCQYVDVPMDQQGMSVINDLKTLFAFRNALKKEKPDVFLGYTVKPNVYGSLAAHTLGVPVINNVAGLGTAFLKGGALAKLVRGLYKCAFTRSCRVFFQNEDDRTQFIAEGLVKEPNVDLLPGSGVDLDKYQPVEYVPRRAEKTVFLFVGRLLKDKGVLELVGAMRQVKKKFPDVVLRLLGFVGVANRTAIAQEEVDEWQREGVIDYLGSRDDVKPEMIDADCVVLPSYREGTPRVLLEAGALCRPMIATDVPGCRQVVDHEVSGFLCKSHDEDDLAKALLRFVEADDEFKKQMSEASRYKVESEYDEKLVIRKYSEAIARLGSR